MSPSPIRRGMLPGPPAAWWARPARAKNMLKALGITSGDNQSMQWERES